MGPSKELPSPAGLFHAPVQATPGPLAFLRDANCCSEGQKTIGRERYIEGFRVKERYRPETKQSAGEPVSPSTPTPASRHSLFTPTSACWLASAEESYVF